MFNKLLALLAVVGLASKLRKSEPGERIQIATPSEGASVTSPLSVEGTGQASQHNQLSVRVRDEQGNELATGNVSINGALGARGRFSGTFTYRASGPNQRGRVEVYDTSPRDGNVVHLSSVEVFLS